VLRTVAATRYVAPLREGGSLPALVEGDDDGLYVVKLRGAGQGVRALVAEVLVGRLAQLAGLPVPELVIVDVDAELARAEPDPEIQDLVTASAGSNAGLDFLPGSLPYAPAAARPPDAALAADVVWFDALVMNVDRTPRNPNLLVWHGRTWLIDHGAAFYLQHGDAPLARSARAAFAHIADHVLLAAAEPIAAADERLAARAMEATAGAAALVPDGWLGADPAARRADLVAFLEARLQAPRPFVEEAERARA
jgi:hypothetical protein